MVKKIENLTLRTVEHLAGDDHGEYVGEYLLMAMSARRFGWQFLQIGQPYRVDDGRVMRVLSGHAHSIINMEPHDLETGMLVVVPPDSVFEIEEMDEDFDLQTFSFRDLQNDVTFKDCTVFRLENDDWQLTSEYFHLLWHTVCREPLSYLTVQALQTALFRELHNIHKKEATNIEQHRVNRKDEIYHRFVALLNEHATREHTISFYAGRLCLTSNYLGAVIREVSGQTVMQWVHRYIIQQAKLQLKYSDLPIWQIAENLHFPNPSFFSKFFKRETGMKPAEFRSNK